MKKGRKTESQETYRKTHVKLNPGFQQCNAQKIPRLRWD